jgi:hypothetical protein
MDFNYEGKSKVADVVIACSGITKTAYMVFFEKTVVAITLEKSFIKATDKKLKEKYKSEGLGFFKRSSELSKYWGEFGERFYYMSMEELDNTFNKVEKIDYVDITKYELTPRDRNVIRDGDVVDEDGDILIKSKDAKISFFHRYEKDIPEYKRILEILEKNAVNSKKGIFKI